MQIIDLDPGNRSAVEQAAGLLMAKRVRQSLDED